MGLDGPVRVDAQVLDGAVDAPRRRGSSVRQIDVRAVVAAEAVREPEIDEEELAVVARERRRRGDADVLGLDVAVRVARALVELAERDDQAPRDAARGVVAQRAPRGDDVREVRPEALHAEHVDVVDRVGVAGRRALALHRARERARVVRAPRDADARRQRRRRARRLEAPVDGDLALHLLLRRGAGLDLQDRVDPGPVALQPAAVVHDARRAAPQQAADLVLARDDAGFVVVFGIGGLHRFSPPLLDPAFYALIARAQDRGDDGGSLRQLPQIANGRGSQGQPSSTAPCEQPCSAAQQQRRP